MTDYRILSQEEQDDVVVAFLLSQERDKFAHELNLKRFDTMLKSLQEGEWKKRVTGLRDETVKRLAEVSSTIDATIPQLPSSERLKAAKQRLLSKANQKN